MKKVLRQRVVDLLDTGTEKDLNDVPNMSSKKLQIILANRPYGTWGETVSNLYFVLSWCKPGLISRQWVSQMGN